MKTVADPRGGRWKVRRRWLEHGTPLLGWTLIRSSNWLAGVLFMPLLVFFLATRFFELCGAVFRRSARGEPWTIEAVLDARSRPDVLRWRVVGWSQSGRALREAVAALARGDEVTSFGEPERAQLEPRRPPHRYSSFY
jgi:hypothetical protein